jgi:hypothetical protein
VTDPERNSGVDLRRSTVQVLGSDGSACGTGFLVGDNTVLTCAHVIADGYGAAHKMVKVRFPSFGGLTLDAYRLPKPRGLEADVAFLLLSAALPLDASSLRIDETETSSGTEISTLGYPRRGAGGGVYGSGIVRGSTDSDGEPLLQIGGMAEATKGFSGAPIVNAQTGLVVGILVGVVPPDALGRLGETSYAIPSTRILK